MNPHEVIPGWKPRWKDYYFNPPELNINEQQRAILRGHYLKSLERGYMFRSEWLTNYYANVDMLEDVFSPTIMKDLRRITQGWEFCVGYGGLIKHVDEQRIAAITIPLFNEENVPLEFYDYDNNVIIEKMYYEYKTWIFRTKEDHSVSQRTTSPRIMMTGSIMHDSFDDLLYYYQEGKLFK
jgi:hypothetical protein